MPPRSSKGESKQGLIITLVFFILATLGLGVATYFGFADQETKEKAAKKAEDEKKLFQNERDYYKVQAELYRVYMGQGQNIDLAALGTRKSQLEQGTMKIDTYKDKDDVKKIIADFDKRFGWNAKENKPNKTFEDDLTKASNDYETLFKKYKETETTLATAKTTIQKRDEELKEAQKTYEANLGKFKNQSNTDEDANRKAIQDLRDEITRIGNERDNDKKKAEEDKKTLLAQMKKKDDDIKHLNERVKDQADRLEQVQAKSTEAPASLRTDWKIVKMDARGTNPYINLGSADRVKPQLTFNIYGVGLDGRVNPQPKGTLEVVNVINDHLSRTRVTSVKDPNRDPILEGDVVYNASWNPNLHKHVALAGIMDLTGDGRDSLPEFMRNLERQNIVIDAWLDPKDGSIKGNGITVRTDYLITGESQEFSLTGREKSGDFQKKLEAGRKQMEAQAAKNGVQIVPLHKYLEMIGYRLPHRVGGENRSLYDPSLRPEAGPRRGEKAPPAMPADK
jgi:hypothetical protein